MKSVLAHDTADSAAHFDKHLKTKTWLAFIVFLLVGGGI